MGQYDEKSGFWGRMLGTKSHMKFIVCFPPGHTVAIAKALIAMLPFCHTVMEALQAATRARHSNQAHDQNRTGVQYLSPQPACAETLS